jgi:hypothetical protein
MTRWTERAIDIRERFSKKVLIYSAIVFLLSIIIYNATNLYVWDGLAGLAMIISGSIFALFIITLFILWVLERMEQNKIKKMPAKKIVTKTTKKKVVKKKVAKKAPAKKKVTKKKTNSKKKK